MTVVAVGDWLAPPDDRPSSSAQRARRSGRASTTTTSRCHPGSSCTRWRPALGRPPDQVRAALIGARDTGRGRRVSCAIRRARARRVRHRGRTRARSRCSTRRRSRHRHPPIPRWRARSCATARSSTLDGIVFTTRRDSRALERVLRTGARRAAGRSASATCASCSGAHGSTWSRCSSSSTVKGFTRRRGDVRVAGPRLASGLGDQL